MRVGQNPAKSIDYVKKPENITVAIITYIPFLSGYYKQSLDILKICLNSLWENTKLPFDLMVFDNASCKEVTEYLLEMQSLGKIQYLTLSDKNIGKGGGWNFIFNAAPGKYIAYADADIEFYENWLVESIKVIDTFPNVGMVTGRPLRTPKEHFTAVVDWVEREPGAQINEGNHIGVDTHNEHALSLGLTIEESNKLFDESTDFLVQYKNINVYAGSAHFQFTGKSESLKSILPFNMDRPMGQVRRLDIKLNENGYLRLSTINPYVKHLGNTINFSLNKKITLVPSSKYFLWGNKYVKRILLFLYNKIFNIYFKTTELE